MSDLGYTQAIQEIAITDSSATATVAVKAASVAAVAADPALVIALSPNSQVAKGTQGTAGLPVQNLKDAGRSQVMLAWEEMAGTAAVESTLTNFTLGSKAAGALGAATSYTVTTGKTLRIQEVTVYVKATSTVNNLARFRIRQAASAIANTSPVIFDKVLALGVPGTIASGLLVAMDIPIPDGLEVASTQQITFTWLTAANTCTVGLSLTGYEY